MTEAPFIANPFTVQTPEDLGARETRDLFVDVFTDFAKIREGGHCMVNGPRGCGKSMMFRYLLPDCQSLVQNCSIPELPFFAVLISIKNTAPNITELQRLIDRHANIVLNEHFLTMYVASRIFWTFARSVDQTPQNLKSAREFYKDEFCRRLQLSGWTKNHHPRRPLTVKNIFTHMQRICDELYASVIAYVKHLTFPAELEPYHGPLCGYLDFLYPLLEEARSLPFMPDGPTYLLFDDADYLNLVQTRILNSWISTRTSASISIKVSTQLRYKTFTTIGRTSIASPHDYHEVNISDLYTTSRSKYLLRVTEIVQKRLALADIKRTPEEFFPPDIEQERAIEAIADEIRGAWKTSGRGYRPSDDVLRYARPNYIASLKGKSKSGSTYNYAGFQQLVHISSGLIRYFLEPAAVMFSEQQAVSGNQEVSCISPGIQDKTIRDIANDLMFYEFDKLFKEEEDQEGEERRDHLLEKKRSLHNLIKALGGVFHQKLISQDSERRVFSVAFSDTPDPEVLEIFNLGIRFGYFQRSSIGNKDGTGRTPLYVLTRRLAPYFYLDPTGFAGYLFVTSERIREAIENPESFLRRVKSRGAGRYFEEHQLQLFD